MTGEKLSRAHAGIRIRSFVAALHTVHSYAVPSSSNNILPGWPTLLLGHVVLLLEQVTLDLGVLELLQVAICAKALVHISQHQPTPMSPLVFFFSLTSEVSALLQVVHALSVVCLLYTSPSPRDS